MPAGGNFWYRVKRRVATGILPSGFISGYFLCSWRVSGPWSLSHTFAMTASSIKGHFIVNVAKSGKYNGNFRNIRHTCMKSIKSQRLNAETPSWIHVSWWTHFVTVWPQWHQWPRAHGPLARYVKLWVAHATGMPGTFSPPPTSKETAN